MKNMLNAGNFPLGTVLAFSCKLWNIVFIVCFKKTFNVCCNF